ncbi:unnamed protein product, partial [Allacma fusca]
GRLLCSAQSLHGWTQESTGRTPFSFFHHPFVDTSKKQQGQEKNDKESDLYATVISLSKKHL